MSLTHPEMARLGELLDEALPLSPEQRRTWLESLSGADESLVRTLRDALLEEEAAAVGPLDRPPRIEAPASGEEAAVGHHPGERLGAYELLRLLGSGGMADVWLARRTDGAFERQVALKIPRLQSRPVEMAARSNATSWPRWSIRGSRVCTTPAWTPAAFPTLRWSTSRANRWWRGATRAGSTGRRASGCSCRYWTRWPTPMDGT
jgi:hypothetical protein